MTLESGILFSSPFFNFCCDARVLVSLSVYCEKLTKGARASVSSLLLVW